MRSSSLATVLVVTSLLPVALSNERWKIPTSSQYHIQTDEGPERYFQYQTQSGQYRKEKRLEDGTVVGTSAWIDGNGMLWLRDYMADNEGYRILRSKNMYVGQNTPIERAVKAAKHAAAMSGVLVKSNPSPTIPYSYTPPIKPQNTYLPSVSQVQINPHSGASSGSTHLPADVSTLVTPTSASPTATPPVVNIPSSTPSSVYIPSSPSPAYLPSSTPSLVLLNPSTSSSVYLPAATPPSNHISSSPHSSAQIGTNSHPISAYASSTPSNLYALGPISSTIAPPLSSNDVDYNESDDDGYNSTPYENYGKTSINPYVYQNGPTYPIDKKGRTFNGYSNKIGNGYDPQYPEYDGVSVTNDGFRYYIPRAYHEEQNLPGNTKSGSFGYIDPFGIRRVIYYNTSPGSGFQHRKNNRYVGFNATPYDPRPY